MEKEKERLKLWQERLAKNQSAYAAELDAMDEREQLYLGSRKIQPKAGTLSKQEIQPASMVRNIVSELVEAQVDSSVPMPKVTARRQEDEELAVLIEAYLRNEIDRLPFERMNDLDERITPVQGGDFFLVEWDAGKHTHSSSGELSVRLLHPKQVIPQDGVMEIEDMDFIIVKTAMTKQKVKAIYGKEVEAEEEEDPDARNGESTAEDVVTVNTGYFRNENGGIGRYVWVNDTELEYLEDYQARLLRHCKRCGAVVNGDFCENCGCQKWEEKAEAAFPLQRDWKNKDFTVPAWKKQDDGRFAPNQIPYYQPNCYPLVLRRNVSSFGKVLGESDAEKIQDQQNAIKKCDTRVQDKLDKGGSVLTKHIDSKMEFTDEQLKVVEVANPAELSCLQVFNLQADTSGDLAVAEQNYQSARNILGVTDSFQGRPDRTATSGRAKEIAVSQSAGRLESKRIMKNATYADLYRVMFQFLLAYSDEPRTVRQDSLDGNTEYKVFDKMAFLSQDAAGAYFWKDDFLFSVDTSTALAANRESMWQEVRQNFDSGVFGDPSSLDTLLLFWRMMAKLHYPMAEDVCSQLESQKEKQEAAPPQTETEEPMLPEGMDFAPEAGDFAPESELPIQMMQPENPYQ